MTTNDNPLLGAYLEKGTIGDVGMLGAPILSFALVVVPGQHKVTGTVQITQAVLNGNYSGAVTGTIFLFPGADDGVWVITLTGTVHNDGTMPISLPITVHFSVGGIEKDYGGFDFGQVHVAYAPVTIAPGLPA